MKKINLSPLLGLVLSLLLSSMSAAQTAPANFQGTDVHSLPVEAYRLFKVAKENQGVGDFAAAIRVYQKTLAIAPFFPEAHLYMGQCLEELHKIPEAQKQYQEALSQWPQYDMAHFLLGNTYFHQGDLKRAEALFLETVAINSGFSEAYNNLGALYIAERNFSAAETNLLKARELRKKDWNTLTQLGNLYYLQKNYPKALEFLQEARRLEPKEPDILILLGNTFLEMKNYSKAQKTFEAVNEIKPHADAFHGLGLTQYRQKKYSEAEGYFNRAITLDPKHPKARFYLAKVLEFSTKKGHLQQAIAVLQRLLNDVPTMTEARFNLAVLYQRVGREADAHVESEKLKQQSPQTYEDLQHELARWR